MKGKQIYQFLLLILLFFPMTVFSQGFKSIETGNQSAGNVDFNFSGIWAYRSLHNNSDLDLDFSKLAFGKGTMVLNVEGHKISGTIGGPGWNLDLSGYINGSYIRFQGKGLVGEEIWVYDYAGELIMPWPHGIDQNPTIVGSVIRTKEHSEGKSPAGYVATFYSVRK
jgi:hypothetical protein